MFWVAGVGRERAEEQQETKWFRRRWWKVRSEGAVAVTASDLEMV